MGKNMCPLMRVGGISCRSLAASHTLPVSGDFLTWPPAIASLQAIGEVQGLDRPHGKLAGLGVDFHFYCSGEEGLVARAGCACAGVWSLFWGGASGGRRLGVGVMRLGVGVMRGHVCASVRSCVCGCASFVSHSLCIFHFLYLGLCVLVRVEQRQRGKDNKRTEKQANTKRANK